MIEENYLADIRRQFHLYYTMALAAMDQLREEEINRSGTEGLNSVAVLVRHLHGNIRSRWTDFLDSDGEKPWRHRDREFENDPVTPEQLKATWLEAWQQMDAAIASIKPEDLSRIIYIRNEGFTLVEAIHRQLTHYAYHVGQLVDRIKGFRGADWKSLSVPPGKSVAYNARMFARPRQRHQHDWPHPEKTDEE